MFRNVHSLFIRFAINFLFLSISVRSSHICISCKSNLVLSNTSLVSDIDIETGPIHFHDHKYYLYHSLFTTYVKKTKNLIKTDYNDMVLILYPIDRKNLLYR
jgi:hypothetical protein